MKVGELEFDGSIVTADGAAAGASGDTLALQAGAGHATSGDGGSVSITAGVGVDAGDGGDITLTPGAGAGAGSAGATVIAQTTAPTVTTNKLYNVAGALTWNGTDISAGGSSVFTEDGATNLFGGTGAGAAISAGVDNILIGEDAGAAVSNGDHNIFIGHQAGDNLSLGDENIAIGFEALTALAASNSENVAIGHQAGLRSGSGASNTMVGYRAGENLDSASNIVAIGSRALGAATGNLTGANCIGIGRLAGSGISTGADNICIGFETGAGLASSPENVLIGRNAFSLANSGTGGNVMVGHFAGDFMNGASAKNVCIGYRAGKATPAGAQSNQLYINNAAGVPLIGGDFSANTVTITGTLSVTLGTDGLTNAAGNRVTTTSTTPSSGQVLTATSATVATWQTPGGLFSEDADDNIIGGTGAGANLSGGSAIFNFVAGIDAGAAITTGDYNIAIGHRALYDATAALTGINNIAIGRSAMASSALAAADHNIAMGLSSLNALSTGDNNIALGQDALGQSNTASQNIALGWLAGSDITTGGDNVMVGAFTGRSITTSTRNTALGYQAMGNAGAALVSPAGDNVAVGASSMSNASLGEADKNIAVGSSALNFLTTGDDNVAIGYNAGGDISTGSGNVMLGNQAGPTSNQSNRLYINNTESDTPLIGGDFATPKVTINGDQEVTGAVISTIDTLADSATPTVASGKVWLTGGTTTITDFTNGVPGQEIIIMSEHAITITDGTNMFLNGSTNFVMASTDSLYLIQKADGNWYEISRSVN